MTAGCMTRLVAIAVLLAVACAAALPNAGMGRTALRAWREARAALRKMAGFARALPLLVSLPVLPMAPRGVAGPACHELLAISCTWRC